MIEWLSNHPWIIIALVVHAVVLGAVAYFILLERKVASWVQDRVGPNRVGPGGLLQPLADGLKFVLKEDYRAAGTDKRLFTIAPAIMMIVMVVSVAVIPWGGWVQKQTSIAVPAGQEVTAAARGFIPSNAEIVAQPSLQADGTYLVTYRWPFQIANLNIGVLFIIAVLSLGVYGIVVGGWASNNKYSFLGGLRATAQMISYEIPLGLALLAVVLMFGTLDLGAIVEKQSHYWVGVIPAWNVFCQPLAFLLFLICIHAEANRAPFDLAEAEQELVGGYHTEYSSMRFALFFLAEYAGMITTSAVCVALFFGGWHFPGLTGPADDPAVTGSVGMAVVRSLVFFVKVLVLVFVFMWVRWSLPRFRFDQLMLLAWRAMIPLSLAIVMVTAIVVYAFGRQGFVWVNYSNMGISARMAATLFAVNVLGVVLMAGLSLVLPAAPQTNRRLRIPGSRFARSAAPTAPTA